MYSNITAMYLLLSVTDYGGRDVRLRSQGTEKNHPSV